MKAQGLSVRPLVAGYGIRWNADHDRQSRAYEAREVSTYTFHHHHLPILISSPIQVINQILSEDLAKYHSTNRRRGTDVTTVSYFNGISFDGGDWEDLNALNQELLVGIYFKFFVQKAYLNWKTLQPFLVLTKHFEEDSANGSIVLLSIPYSWILSKNGNLC